LNEKKANNENAQSRHYPSLRSPVFSPYISFPKNSTVPRISDTDGRGIHFAEASTVLVVGRGKWVALSENRQETHEVAREILSKGNADSHTALSFSLFVEP
jgi:hypothetical protein